MTDDTSNDTVLDVGGIATSDIAAIGDSALGHAIRRARALHDPQHDSRASDVIAAHDSHV